MWRDRCREGGSVGEGRRVERKGRVGRVRKNKGKKNDEERECKEKWEGWRGKVKRRGKGGGVKVLGRGRVGRGR